VQIANHAWGSTDTRLAGKSPGGVAVRRDLTS
jgi:hypothetical protein